MIITSKKKGRYWGLFARDGKDRYEMVLCPTSGDSVKNPKNLEKYFDPRTEQDHYCPVNFLITSTLTNHCSGI